VTGDLAAIRAVSGLQLAVLDGRQADADLILARLDAAQLRAVATELLAVWRDVVRFNYTRDAMRAAVAADALAQASMDDTEGTPS
jgi:hypothetical protein